MNKYEEAINYIKRDLSGVYAPEKYFEAHYMAIEAMGKQIPQKPIKTNDKSWGIESVEYDCPQCHNRLSHYEFANGAKKVTYCDHCGQAIDWEDVK